MYFNRQSYNTMKLHIDAPLTTGRILCQCSIHFPILMPHYSSLRYLCTPLKPHSFSLQVIVLEYSLFFSYTQHHVPCVEFKTVVSQCPHLMIHQIMIESGIDIPQLNCVMINVQEQSMFRNNQGSGTINVQDVTFCVGLMRYHKLC